MRDRNASRNLSSNGKPVLDPNPLLIVEFQTIEDEVAYQRLAFHWLPAAKKIN